MPLYAYKVRDFFGKKLTGTLEAEDITKAMAHLQARGFFIVDLRPRRKILKSKLSLLEKRVSSQELGSFCRLLVTMLDSGIPMLASLDILTEQSKNKKLKVVIGEVKERLAGGSALATAMGAYPKIFPELLVHMVKAGEMGGALDEILRRMAIHFEKESEMVEKVKSALTYPAVLILVAIVSVIFLLTFVLPAFVTMLASMNVALPLPTKMVIALSGLMHSFWYLGSGLLAIFAYVAHRYLKTDRGQRWKDRLLLHLPIVGDLLRKIIISRFSRTLSTLLRGGVPILQALEVVAKTAGNTFIMDSVEKARDNIRIGGSISGPLSETGVFPPMIIEIVAVGEETGSLDTLLTRVGDYYDREVDHMVNRLASLIEPLMIVGLGIVVGLILLSILLPMFSVIGEVN